MTGPRQVDDLSGIWGWRAVKLVTVLVYIFMFAPILVTIILSFNASMFGGFPMTGLSLQWYGKLFQNEAVLRAFKTSVWIAILTAAVCTVIGVAAAIALTRYEFRGKHWMNTLVILPA
ncbi:MAG: ABC transporter permease, partial [Parvibaculaceae bacterium]